MHPLLFTMKETDDRNTVEATDEYLKEVAN